MPFKAACDDETPPTPCSLGNSERQAPAYRPVRSLSVICNQSQASDHNGSSGGHPSSQRSPANQQRDEGSNTKRFHGLRTLIVEDEIIDQKLAAVNAARLGLNVTMVSTATEAVEHLKHTANNNPFELLIMDFQMPSIDGLAASNMIKNQIGLQTPPKIILMSSYHRDEIFAGVSERGYIDDFLTKPITREKLEQTLVDLSDKTRRQGSEWPQISSTIDSGDSDSDDETLARTHVLLAEDNLINQRVAIGTLKQKGVQVTVANNGREAIEKVRSMPPKTYDLILMDMDMPKVDGYEATETILSDPAFQHIPIIALTAQIADSEQQRCLNLGMAEYLTKPVKPEILYKSIIKHLK